jgi:hypothetical protein
MLIPLYINIQIGPLCCAQTSYYQADWQSCNDAADFTSTAVQTCATCLSYACIDWVVGSAAMTQREADYYRETNDSVYFAVGAFGNDSSKAGLCYRITTAESPVPLIAQVGTLRFHSHV